MISVLLLLSAKSWSQDIDSFALKVLRIFKENDSAAFTQLPVQPGDSKYIMADRFKSTGSAIEPDEADVAMPDSSWSLFKKNAMEAFRLLRNKGTEQGVNWKSSDGSEYNFRISKQADFGFPLASGTITLSSKTGKLVLSIRNAVKIHGVWRLAAIDIEEDGKQ